MSAIRTGDHYSADPRMIGRFVEVTADSSWDTVIHNDIAACYRRTWAATVLPDARARHRSPFEQAGSIELLADVRIVHGAAAHQLRR